MKLIMSDLMNNESFYCTAARVFNMGPNLPAYYHY